MPTNTATKRNPNVLHSILSHQRPIAPKNETLITTKSSTSVSEGNSPPYALPSISLSSLDETLSFVSSSNSSIQTFRKNFQCRLCHLTYKVGEKRRFSKRKSDHLFQNFHDCTAHIRKKHEISHVQAGRYVDKLDTDVPLPPSATGHYKIRVKSKSIIGQNVKIDETKKQQFQCEFCSFTSSSSTNFNEHQRTMHLNTMSEENLDQDRFAEFLIDPIREFGEVIEPTDNSHEEISGQDDEILIQADDDEDEDEA